MRSLTFVIACGVLSLAACAETVDPTGPSLAAVAPSAAGGDLTPDDPCVVPDPPPGTIPWADDAPLLETYCTILWVTQGKDDEVSVQFAESGTPKARWFLRLWIPEDAQLVDQFGEPVPDGTVVPVTVAIHPTLYAVRFGPHGAGFNGRRPAVLKLNYSWADLEEKDAKNLQIYYQADWEGDWVREPTIVDKKGQHLTMFLRHFSNYAVAW